jgi:endonuclease YncB( thermonuclease family)
LLDIDAAEIHRLGKLTKHRLEQLLHSGPIAFCPDPPTQRDKYGRLLLHVLVNGEDVACVLIREGYARPWRGRRENWCVKVDPADSAVPELDCTITSSVETRSVPGGAAHSAMPNLPSAHTMAA